MYNVPEGGAFRLTEATFESAEDFAIFRRRAVAHFRPMASIREGLVTQLLRGIKHLFMVDLYYPNILMLLWRTRARLARHEGRVVIMSSSPPFSLALVGALLKCIYPTRVVLAIDMRDPWTLHKSLGGIRPLKRWIENKVLHQADALSTVSYGLRDQFVRTHQVSLEVFFNVASHYFDRTAPDPVDWQALNPAIAPGRIKLVYTGSTPVGYYDLTSLVRAVRDLRQTAPAAADRLQLVFVGACAEMKQECDAHGIDPGDVVFIPHVAHQTARAIQQNADVLLFLTYLGEGAVSTKIFEYLALGRPIFPISAPHDKDADRLLRTYCGRSLNLHAAGEIRDALFGLAGVGGVESLPRTIEPDALRRLLDDYSDYAARLLSKVRS